MHIQRRTRAKTTSSSDSRNNIDFIASTVSKKYPVMCNDWRINGFFSGVYSHVDYIIPGLNIMQRRPYYRFNTAAHTMAWRPSCIAIFQLLRAEITFASSNISGLVAALPPGRTWDTLFLPCWKGGGQLTWDKLALTL